MSQDLIGKLKSDGDQIERQFAERIGNVLPAYARFWFEYVGNDGRAIALPMAGADKAAAESRAKYWQRLYTILESIVLCWDIEEELHRLQEVKTFKTYAQNLNMWMAFYSHLGRIHDMVKAFSGELDRPDLLKPFDEYWKERHIVLHGPKVPMKWVYNTLATPQLGQAQQRWNDKMVWHDLAASDFDFISADVSRILREVEVRLDRCIAELRKLLPATYGWKAVQWPFVPPGVELRVNFPVEEKTGFSGTDISLNSGTGTWNNISGSHNG